MNMTDIYRNLYNESKKFYETSERHFQQKRKLAGMLKENFSPAKKKYTDEEMDMIRRSSNGELIRKARAQADYDLESAFRHYLKSVEDTSGYLPEAVEAVQPELDLTDPALRNALEISKLGRDLPMGTAREVLGSFRKNKAQFEIVRKAMEHSGVNPAFFKGITAYNGEDMASEYSAMVEKLRGRSDESIYSGLLKVQDRILRDASGFGITLDPFISEEARDRAGTQMACTAMGLKSDYQKSVEVLEDL